MAIRENIKFSLGSPMNFLENLADRASSRWTVILLVLTGFVVFLSILLYFDSDSSVQVWSNAFVFAAQTGVSTTHSKKISAVYPVRIMIPKIKVDAFIESVGITSGWAMDSPKGRANAGWFSFGPRPGEIGSAVIDGHAGVWKDGVVAVFHNLRNINKGDKITIRDSKGVITTFVVRKLQRYAPNANASAIFTSSDGKSHLNLITCGVRNKFTRHYSKRLVIFTDKE